MLLGLQLPCQPFRPLDGLAKRCYKSRDAWTIHRCEVNCEIIPVQVPQSYWLHLTVWSFSTCWTLLSRMLCVCPDSWDPALNVGSEMHLSSYSLDLDTPLRHLASQ